MGIYIAFYVISTILFIILSNNIFVFPTYGNKHYKTEQQSKLFMVIVTGMLILILGLRSEYQGVDLYNSLGTGYFYYYDRINGDSLGEIFKYFDDYRYANFEIGFVLMSKFAGTICNGHQTLLLVSAFLAIVPVAHFIWKHSKNAWLSLTIYMALPMFLTVTFSAIRQGISIALVVWSWGLIKEKKLVPFVLTIILACSFHSTAIVALVCYPLFHLRLDKKSALWGGGCVLAFIYFMRVPLFWILARLVHNRPQINETNAVNLFFLLGGSYMICVLLTKKEDYETRGYMNIYLLAAAAQAFAGVHNLAGRITWYFMPVLIMVIPNLLENGNIKEKRQLKALSGVICIAAILIGLYNFKNNSMAMAYPYVPFWKQG